MRSVLSKKVNCLPQQADVAQGVPVRLRLRIFSTFGTTRVVGDRYCLLYDKILVYIFIYFIYLLLIYLVLFSGTDSGSNCTTFDEEIINEYLI